MFLGLSASVFLSRWEGHPSLVRELVNWEVDFFIQLFYITSFCSWTFNRPYCKLTLGLDNSNHSGMDSLGRKSVKNAVLYANPRIAKGALMGTSFQVGRCALIFLVLIA